MAADASDEEPSELDGDPGIDDIEEMEDLMPPPPAPYDGLETAPDARDPNREPLRRAGKEGPRRGLARRELALLLRASLVRCCRR